MNGRLLRPQTSPARLRYRLFLRVSIELPRDGVQKCDANQGALTRTSLKLVRRTESVSAWFEVAESRGVVLKERTSPDNSTIPDQNERIVEGSNWRSAAKGLCSPRQRSAPTQGKQAVDTAASK